MSAVLPRKKSPRAPSIALDEALERALKAYDKERLHPAPAEVVAQNMGYKTANSGTALSAIASLRYYGLIDRPSDGQLAVTKDLESYKYTPDDALKRSLLKVFLERPPLFAELLAQYASGLPSDANIRYELIQRGFLPASAEAAVGVFRRSVEFVGYFDASYARAKNEGLSAPTPQDDSDDGFDVRPAQSAASSQSVSRPAQQAASPLPVSFDGQDGGDQIPVRLPGGRRAWLIIPTPFYAADKTRLKAQIDLLLTQDEEDLA